jgi:hypothetical protein
MKIKRQISAKATKRFKIMVLAAMALFAVSYLSDDMTGDMADYMWFVDAADDESADISYDITIDDVEDKMNYQINSTSTGEKLMWKDKEYKHFAYIQR